MSVSSGAERLAILEEFKKNTEKNQDKMAAALEKISSDVGNISLKVEKSMSFVGGMAFTFSALGAGLVMIIQAVWKLVS
jgi:hypothetical protein